MLPAIDIPGPDDPVSTAAHWRWLREHQLRLQRCTGCGLTRTPAAEVCHVCHSTASEWIEVPAAGEVFSWTRVWHPAAEHLVGHTPYVVVWVQVDHPDQPRFVGNLLGDPHRDVTIGERVVGVFEDRAHGTILNWRRDEA